MLLQNRNVEFQRLLKWYRRVAPDYATDFSVPILDRGRNAKRKRDRLLDHIVYTVHVST